MAFEVGQEMRTIAGAPTGVVLLEILPKPRGIRIRLKGRFRCVCGQEWITWIGDVRNGKTKSCGCHSRKQKNRHKAEVGDVIGNEWFVMAVNGTDPIRGWLYDVVNLKSRRVRRNVTRRMIERQWEEYYRGLVVAAWRSASGQGRYDRIAVLGCGYVEFQDHIKRQFLPGMTVENYGDWHLDHIVPLCTATNAEECAALSHYSNIRPRWAKDNLSDRRWNTRPDENARSN